MMSDEITTDKLMETFPQLDQRQARRIASIIEFQWGSRAEMATGIIHTMDAMFPATFKWLRQCHNYPSMVAMKMHIFDEILDTHGVEGFPLDGYFSNPYLDGTHFEYCNTGHTYRPTIGYCPIKNEFIITSQGDYQEWAEQNGHKMLN